MMRLTRLYLTAVLVPLLCLAAKAPLPVYVDPAKTDADFAIQGEYLGKVQGKEGEKTLATQVIALGNHKFRAVGYVGGLPGDGWNGQQPEEVEAAADDGVVTFKGQHASGTIREGVMKVVDPDGKEIGQLQRISRQSPALGAKPPAGALVLFDGTTESARRNWVAAGKPGLARITDDGLLMQGANSRHLFGKHHLHIEFRLPYMPTARGQQRGNSGCYLQGRYEVQMLDSFGLKGMDNECGGIYEIGRPKVNMCFPPLSWQTYEVDFTPAEFHDHGKKLRNARITVRHNGVVIHNNLELPRSTRAAPVGREDAQPSFLHLQDHGDQVRYRNIWAVEE